MNCSPVRLISQRISIQHLWTLVILAGVFIFVNTHPIRPHDFWWHLAVGREILSSGQIPQVDSYSYTASGTPYPSFQAFWLMEIALYGVYSMGGAALVIFIQSLLVTSTYLMVFVTCLKQVNNWRLAALGTGFAALLGMNDWNVRPQTIAFFLGAIFLFLVTQLQRGARWIWAISFPVLMVIWVNSHGSYPLGLFFLILWLLQEIWNVFRKKPGVGPGLNLKRILLPLSSILVTAVACLLNPSGIKLLTYQQSLWKHTIVQNMVAEWAPPGFDSLGGGLFLAALVLIAVILAVSPRSPNLFQIAAFLGIGYLGLRTSRGIIWFGLMMAPVVVYHSCAILERIRKNVTKPTGDYRGNPLINWMFLGIILLCVVITLPWLKDELPMPEAKAGLISRETPVQATEYILGNHLPGNIFHAMSFGSYLIWAAQPDYRVFVDGRIELFSDDIWVDYLLISSALADWEDDLEKYGVNTLMLSKSEQQGLVNALMESDNWELVFEDSAALIFISR